MKFRVPSLSPLTRRSALLLGLGLLARASQAQGPEVTSWLLNTTGQTGYMGATANVQQVRYSANYVYVNATGIPSYTIGPWPGNPGQATNQNYLFKFTRNPAQNTGTPTATGLGNIGVWKNGATLFNAKDAFSYNSQGKWNQNAIVVEGSSFDNCEGHPNQNGTYHHHLNPTCLYNDRDSTAHSPLLGYAFDGFPIYGAYGYTNTNGTGAIKSMKTSYRERSITQRTTLPDGTVLPASQYGPAVSTQYPLGYYIEDFQYVAGSGDLDEHNGRFCVTPEYPGGTYAYFITLNTFYEAAYPYIIGPTYYGVIAAGATSGSQTVNETVTTYTPATPAVDLTVSSTQSISAGTYRDVTITGTGVGTLSGAITVTGTLTVQSGGSLVTNCQTISGSGSFVLATGGSLSICDAAGITSSGSTGAVQVTGTRTFAADASYVYNGTAAQVTGNGLPSQVTNLALTNTAGLALSQNLSISGLLRINSGTLSVSSRSLTLLSSASGTASVLQSPTGAVSGNVTVQRYVSSSTNSGAGYRQLAAPVSGATVASLTASGYSPVVNAAFNTSATPGTVTPFPSIFGYDESRIASTTNNYVSFDKGWYSPASLSTSLGTAVGYSVQTAPTTFSFTGTLRSGNVTTAGLTRGSDANAGWHCVGNPYASTLDWSVLTGSLSSNIASSMYVFESSGPYAGTYRAYVNGVGNPLIASSQAFFVRSLTTGQAPTITFVNGARTAGAATVSRGSADQRPQVALTLRAASGQQDETTLYWENGATAATDAQYDAWKLLNPGQAQLWTEAGTERLSINGLPLPSTASVRIPLSFDLPQAGSYTLQPTTLANLPASWSLQLEDRLLGTTQPLSAQRNIAFQASTAGTLQGRFVLVLNPTQAPLATAIGQLALGLGLYPNPAHGSAQVSLPAVPGASQATLTLVDALGRVVRRQSVGLSAAGALTAIDLSSLAPGVYALRTQAGAETAVRRLVVE